MNYKKILVPLSLLVLPLFEAIPARANVNSDVNNGRNIVSFPIEEPNDREIMKEIILRRLTVWVRREDNEPVYAWSCRNLRFGCERQVEAFVGYIFDEARIQKFDPWLVAAMAWHESRFNPFAVSNENAFGILQMLRRSRWSSGLRFVHNPQYRTRCRNELGSCQREIIERSIYWTRKTISICGSIQGGLRMYNSGRCDGPRRYSRAVLGLQQRFLAEANEFKANGHFENLTFHYLPITCSNSLANNIFADKQSIIVTTYL